MPTRRDTSSHAGLARSASSTLLVLLGLFSTGCDKVQIPQIGPPVAPASAPGSAPTATGAPGTAPPGQSPASSAAAKPDPKAMIATFLQKAQMPFQIEDADLIQVTAAELGLDEIQDLNLAGSKITDKGLATLSKFPKLAKVDLGATPITNEGIQVIKEMPELRVLGLGNTVMDDRAMTVIAGQPGLRELYVQNTKITDFGLNELQELKDLEVLDISSTTIRGAGFEKFRGHKHLRVLRATHTPLQNDAFKFLVGCPIEELSVGASGVSDPGMIHIGKLNEIRRLDLGFCNVSDFGISKLGLMKDLEYISVWNNNSISNLLFAKIQKCKNLKEVVVSGTRISGNDIAKLQKLIPGVKVTP